MNSSCKQCGAALKERDRFCTKCGARRDTSTEAPAGQRFCAKCGAAQEVARFCTRCGALADVVAPVSPMAPNCSPAATPSQATPASRPKPSGLPKVAIAVMAILLVLVVTGIAGVKYVVDRVRQKAAQVEAQSSVAASLADLTAAAKAAQNGKSPAVAQDLEKKPPDLAARAPASAENPNSPASAEDTKKDLATAGEQGQDRSGYAALNAVRKQLDDLQRDAPDRKAATAVNALISKLEQLTLAEERDPTNSKAAADVDRALGEITAAAAKLTPAIVAATDAALTPPPVPSGPPMVPVAGTGDPQHDWPLEYERTVGGSEADLLVRTGDINNLGFGWPSGFDPFSGKSTPPHPWPDIDHIPPQAPPGTDRIMLGTGLTAVHMSLERKPGQLDRVIVDSVIETRTPGDGYSGAMRTCYLIGDLPGTILKKMTDHIELTPNEEASLRVSTDRAASCTRERQLTMPAPIVLQVGELPSKIEGVVVQIFVDDFQAPVFHSYFQVSLNGTRIPTFEYVINSLDQTGPIGKLVSMRLLPEYWPLLKSGTVQLLIDDPTTHVRDGYAADFVRLLVNPHKFKYQVSLTATVTDAQKHTPIPDATVSVGLTSTATDQKGKCELKGIPAGLVVATANAPGYDENSVPVDLPEGQSGHADIQLYRHQETAAALEQSVAQTGTATIYGIHFDTGSSELRADSLPALEAVLALINGRAGSNWVISGHTDNQGSDKLNIPLSKQRAAAVITWLTAHGVAADRLEPQGFGATRPVADNTTANGRFLNRRVEIALARQF